MSPESSARDLWCPFRQLLELDTVRVPFKPTKLSRKKLMNVASTSAMTDEMEQALGAAPESIRNQSAAYNGIGVFIFLRILFYVSARVIVVRSIEDGPVTAVTNDPALGPTRMDKFPLVPAGSIRFVYLCNVRTFSSFFTAGVKTLSIGCPRFMPHSTISVTSSESPIPDTPLQTLVWGQKKIHFHKVCGRP